MQPHRMGVGLLVECCRGWRLMAHIQYGCPTRDLGPAIPSGSGIRQVKINFRR